MNEEFRAMFKTIKLMPLEHAALRECVRIHIDGSKGLDADDVGMYDFTNREAYLDLSSHSKRKHATDIACALGFMAADPDEGWAKTKKRRDVCVQLAVKFNAAVDAAPQPFLVLGRRPGADLVAGRRYLLPDSGSNAGLVLTYKECKEEVYVFASDDGVEHNYAVEDLCGLEALADDAGKALVVPDAQIVPAKEPGDHHNGTSVALVPAVPAQLEPEVEKADAASHPITLPEAALGAMVATETPNATMTTTEGEPLKTDQPLAEAVTLPDEHSAEGRHEVKLDAAVADGAVVQTVDGKSLTASSELLRELETFLRERTVLPEGRFYYPLTLWAALTHCWQACQAELPYLNFTGPSNTGKNHTLKLVGSLSYNFLFVARGTEAVLRDLVNLESPTLGVAECESELRKHNSYVHILFNSGNVPGEPFRKILHGSPHPFEIYCPKMMATIGDVEPSLRSRCIVVPMSEGTPLIGDLEPAYERGRILGKRLHSLIESRKSEISNFYYRNAASKTHERLAGRAWKIWLLLFAICEVLAPERLVELEHAATFCSSFKSRPLRSVREMHALQADRELTQNCERVVLDAALVLADYPGKNVATNDLIAKLLAMPHGWWVGYQCVDSEGRGIGIGDGESGRMTLAKMFKIAMGDVISPPAPHYMSPGKTARGYIVAEVLAAARALKGEGGNVDPDSGDEDTDRSKG